MAPWVFSNSSVAGDDRAESIGDQPAPIGRARILIPDQGLIDRRSMDIAAQQRTGRVRLTDDVISHRARTLELN